MDKRSGTGICSSAQLEVRPWAEDEVAHCDFKDERLGKRFRTLLQQLTEGIGKSIPFACQDWANTKAAYRFLSNPRVSEEAILSGHFHSTRERAFLVDGNVLVLHDTTEISFKHRDGSIGLLGQIGQRTACGILMHSSLVVTREGLPLGIAAVKFWTRDKFKGTKALEKKVNPTRVPIEHKESIRWLQNLRQATELLGRPERCVHVGDRESDIYELFCAAEAAGTHFLVRTCVDRLAGDGTHTIADEMHEVCCKGLHRVETRDRGGGLREAILELKYRRIHVLPPIGKQKHYPELSLTVIHAREKAPPSEHDRIDWKLLTDLPVVTSEDAIEKLNWYALRWKIEVFHKVLKSGCKVEESRLRTAERLVNLIATLCILSWRIFWMTMMNRSVPNGIPELVFTPLEVQILNELMPRYGRIKPALSEYLVRLAKLGGYLDRAHDPPPGNTVIWRGLSKLNDIVRGARIGIKIVGN